jgi:hypothetical protein
MKISMALFLFLINLSAIAQKDTTVVDISPEMAKKKTQMPADEQQTLKVFYSQRMINANTVEVLRKGVMEFRVVHNFGDIGGMDGGVTKFYGLDQAADVKIGFQIGISDKTNILLARTRAASSISELWEFGLKHQFLRHELDDPSHPFSLTAFANIVASSTRAFKDPNSETNFNGFSDRLSETLQVMVARKFGKVSIQLNPTWVYRHYVIPGDQNGIFAMGAALRIPISGKLFFIADYFHPFRSEASKNAYANSPIEKLTFYDPIGIGVEILTQGHIFHLNFTNSKEILENKFIPRTTSNWLNGEFRWGFTMSRNFILFRDKKKK